MTGELLILDGGLQTTLQDAGRFGFQDQGVPVSGVLDAEALSLANHLLGNVPGEAALEVRLTGPRFRVEGAEVYVCLVGSGWELHRLDGGQASTILPPFQVHRLEPGFEFACWSKNLSASGLLALAGGFDVPLVLGSRSTALKPGFGGLQGRALRAGDRLRVRAERPVGIPEQGIPEPSDWTPAGPIRIVPGPQDDLFGETAWDTLLTRNFTIGLQSDRMGLRLQGPVLTTDQSVDIVSDGIATGAIQVPASGEPIILLADHQTAGGYAKIAHVASVDLPRLARFLPGTELQFERVTREQAESLCRKRETLRQTWAQRATLKTEGRQVDQEALYSVNLVSGVIDASAQDD